MQITGKRIVAIVSRDFEEGIVGSGRIKVLRSVMAGLSSAGDLRIVRCYNVLELRSFLAFALACFAFLANVAMGRPQPLQSTLFRVRAERRRILAELRVFNPEVIYVDTVRLEYLLNPLRLAFPEARIIFDMDDLMSRRFDLLRKQKSAISLGYLAPKFPTFVADLIQSQTLSRLLAAYESFALLKAEERAAAVADCTVLVSSVEGQMMRSRSAGRVVVIPPPADLAVPAPLQSGSQLYFVFIGSDRLLQNAQTIDWLVGKWRTLMPATLLKIVGLQSRPAVILPQLEWCGFVDDISTVYSPCAVLLAPTFFGGGVKTKVLEAFGYGCPVAGNSLTFEGIDLPDYPLLLDEMELEQLISNPISWRETLREAAAVGWNLVADRLSTSHHQAAWGRLAGEAE